MRVSVLRRAGLVVGLLMAGVLLVLAVPFALESLGDDGRVLVIQTPAHPLGAPLVLDETAVRRDEPLLADALDAAVRDGSASIGDDDDIARVMAYLDQVAMGGGAAGYNSPPHNATLEWRGHALIALLSVR